MGITSIDVGGITCQYFAVGAGEPIVLLHCTGHSGRQWAELAAALQTDFEVIAPDLCGYGGTAHWPGSGTFNLGVEADLVDALVDKLERPAHLVGHSFGGAVALQLALRHPNHLKSVTLIEPAAFHLLCDGDDEDKRALRQITEIATTVASAVNCGDYVGAMRRFVDYWTGDGTWDALPNPQRIALASRINKVTLDFWATLNDPTRLGDLVDLDVPTLIISGGHSPFPTRRICYHLVRTLPDVKLRTFDDAGHMLPLSHFREIHPLIKAHCDAQHDRKWSAYKTTHAHVRTPDRVDCRNLPQRPLRF